MGFISTFILPKDSDFDAALQAQARITRQIVEGLYKACVDNDAEALAGIAANSSEARSLKSKNFRELLDVFITPYDKESIYRIIVQLDWVALSVRHFTLAVEAYGMKAACEHQAVLEVLIEMAVLLEEGFTNLSKKSPRIIAPNIDLIYDKYDHVVVLCARAMTKLLKQDDCKLIIINREILAQLKEIAKRIHITANSLEDMTIKLG